MSLKYYPKEKKEKKKLYVYWLCKDPVKWENSRVNHKRSFFKKKSMKLINLEFSFYDSKHVSVKMFLCLKNTYHHFSKFKNAELKSQGA